MMLRVVRFLAVALTAIALAGGLAHVFEMPNKMQLSRDDYLTVQQLYRGWWMIGFPVLGALASTIALALMERKHPKALALSLIAASSLALMLGVFFAYTQPVNLATETWTTLPDDWQELRDQWEWSHAVSAGLLAIAFVCLVASLLVEPPDDMKPTGTTTEAIEAYFQRYEEGANSFDPDVVTSMFADSFLGGGPNGVICIRNDEALRAAIPQRREQFAAMGFRSARVLSVEATRLDDRYVMAKVHWRMVFQGKRPEPMEFKFYITYFLFDPGAGPRMVFYISHEDEQKTLRDAGLLPPANA